VQDLLAIGGRQRVARALRDGNHNWHGYDRGLAIRVDVEAAHAEIVLEYETPPEARAEDGTAVSFQAGAVENGRCYLCTETEVLVYGLPGLELEHYISSPWFNDVHHVRPTPDGNVLVASAGLELVLEMTLAGEVRRMWNVLGEDPWARFDPSVDYRRVASTKPHRAHPNFVFYIGEDVWATRFEQGDAVCLTTPGRSFHISDRRVHDGVLHDGHLYFTTVDGSIIVKDTETLETVQVIELAGFHDERTGVLGWCRGLLVEGDAIWVGFSRIRPTRFRENVTWVARGFRYVMPTRIARYDLGRGTCDVEIPLEHLGLAAVYSIFPGPSVAAGPPAAGEATGGTAGDPRPDGP
jgi:hypothetical protein